MMMRLLFSMLSLMVISNMFSQSELIDYQQLPDSSGTIPLFSPSGAWEYIHQVSENPAFWMSREDSLRSDLVRLLNHSTEPYDSISARLTLLNFEGFKVSIEESLIRDSLKIRWLNDSTFIIDSLGWSMDLMMKDEIQTKYPVDFSSLILSDSLLDENGRLDSTMFILDTLVISVIDTAALESLGVSMYIYSSAGISPILEVPAQRRSAQISIDSVFLVYTDTSSYWMAEGDSHQYKLSGSAQLDSLHSAVETLLEYNDSRDSTSLMINDMYGKKTPFWITSGHSNTRRFWVKNYKNDSITLWIGNPGANEISILLEDDIDVKRMSVEQVNHLPVVLKEPERKLAEMEELHSDPEFWEYEVSSAFIFSQAYFSNWAKGGESSLSTIIDMNGNATYNNTVAKTQWINSARLKFGTIVTDQNGLRKNHDLFEINSQYNKNKWGKVDLSASFYMLNQVAKGYKYFPDDSAVVISKFLNPASLTVALGIDYKPFAKTSINLAPLSYKNTFVLDTANIDQTQHGIKPGKRARQELGTQILVMNEISPFEDMTITNKIRLFSNYLNKPQNIDVDWELLLSHKISWFFSIRLNLHLIYDDDVRFTAFDKDGQPILLPDGTEKKIAQAQLKEFIGLTLLFKL